MEVSRIILLFIVSITVHAYVTIIKMNKFSKLDQWGLIHLLQLSIPNNMQVMVVINKQMEV